MGLILLLTPVVFSYVLMLFLYKKGYIKIVKIKKYFTIFVAIFVVINTLFYIVEYRRYVSYAPTYLKESRKEIVNAMMFHIYYTILVKTVRIDFQNPILYPLKTPRDYFYHKGLDKLPKDEGERALWFDMFEVRPYAYSVRARYGSMAKHYRYEFSKNFIDKIYKNIKIFSLYKISDYQTKEVGEDALEIYLDLINIYVADFHLHPRGFLFKKENIQKVETDFEIHKRFVNIYHWEKEFLDYYKNHHKTQYNRVINPNRGWYSPYINYYDNLSIISSFILFYKINNNHLDCVKDKIYFDSVKEANGTLLEFTKTNSVSSQNISMLKRQISDLDVFKRFRGFSGNPAFDLVECKYAYNGPSGHP